MLKLTFIKSAMFLLLNILKSKTREKKIKQKKKNLTNTEDQFFF